MLAAASYDEKAKCQRKCKVPDDLPNRLPSNPVWEVTMAIYRILPKSAFGPDDVSRMHHAYELALVKIGLIDRSDPITEIVARHV